MPGCREAITFVNGFSSNDSYRRLVAGTRSRLYALNERTANWRILADGLGGEEDTGCDSCNDVRFSAAQVGNYAIFTNDYDNVLAWLFDSGPKGVNSWSAEYVQDLQILGITRAKCVVEYNGFAIIGNVEVEGVRKAARIYWSDYNQPLSWIPGDVSLASYHEFGIGEKILAMGVIGKYLMVYTDKTIYQGVLVSDTDLVFNFRQIYTGPNVPKYENTLVDVGNAHLYLSENGIYTIGEADTSPVRVEWMHKASAAIYNGIGSDILAGFSGLSPFHKINENACRQAVAGYNKKTEEVWFSWPTGTNRCPNMSLVFNLRYGSADLVDHGFCAFTNYTPDDRPSIREFLFDQNVCDRSGDFILEGLPEGGAGSISNPPPYIWNEDEDPTLPIAEDSWCARLGGATLDDYCNTCDVESVFIMADAHDFTLKESDDSVFYREQYNDNTGQYTQSGYSTLVQSDMSHWDMDEEKYLNMVLIDYDAGEQDVPSNLNVEVAYGAQPRCTTWKSIGSRKLHCLTEKTEAEHSAANTRPELAAKYQTYYRGRYIGYRFYVSGVGGESCFSRVMLSISRAQGRVT